MGYKQTIKIIELDPCSKLILKKLTHPKTISEISKECAIPIATVYRKISLLKHYNLLEISGDIIDGVRIRMYKKSDIYTLNLKNIKAKKILESISLNPGICYNELKELTGYANGTLSHYLTQMKKEKKLYVKRTKRRTWFFLPQIDYTQIDQIIFLRKETSNRILLFLLAKETATFKEIQLEAKKSPSTVSLSLTRLIDSALVRRIPGIHPKYELINKNETYKAIKTIEPNLLDTLKDRFSDTFSYL